MPIIYKYELHLPETELEIPMFSEPLTVQMQNGNPHVWILHPAPNEPKEKVKYIDKPTAQDDLPF